MGIVKSLLENKFEDQEADHFRSLRVDMLQCTGELNTVLSECSSTLKSIRSETGEESETVSTLQERLRAFEEEAGNPLIEILSDRNEMQSQLTFTLERQAYIQDRVNRGIDDLSDRRAERLAWLKEREKDLQAAIIMFEGEEGISKLTSMLERARATMAQAKDLREDLNFMLAKIRGEPLDELEELDALGDRLIHLAKWI